MANSTTTLVMVILPSKQFRIIFIDLKKILINPRAPPTGFRVGNVITQVSWGLPTFGLRPLAIFKGFAHVFHFTFCQKSKWGEQLKICIIRTRHRHSGAVKFDKNLGAAIAQVEILTGS